MATRMTSAAPTNASTISERKRSISPAGFSKQIDPLLTRATAIEKHPGIAKKIAARSTTRAARVFRFAVIRL